MAAPDSTPLALRGLPFAVLLPAAADAALARNAFPHRPGDGGVFLQSLLLWSAFAVAAWAAVALLARLAPGQRTRRRVRARAPALVVFAAIAPVVAHAALDRHTALGRDLSGLAAPRPWLEAGGALLGLAAVVAAGAALCARWRPVAPALAVAAVVGGVGLPPADEPGRVGSPPGDGSAQDGERPGLLLVVWDTTRAASLSVLAGERDVSPHLAELAEESLVFPDARSASVFTFSSHLTLLTGRYPSQHGGRLTNMRHDPERAPSIARRLAEAGYRTGAFVGTSVLAAGTGIAEGFEVYDDRVDPAVCDTYAWALVHDVQSAAASALPALRNDGRPHWFQDFQRPAGEVLAAARAWIDRPDPRPWFCLVNLYDAHWPYLPTAEGRARFVRDYDGPLDGFGTRGDGVWGTDFVADEDDARHLTDLYEAEIWELDARVAAFLEAVPRDAAILVTSDHGEAFGEAGVWEHDDLYEPQVHVPFLLRLPGARETGVVPGLVSGVDVAPTLLGLAGLEAPDRVGLDLSRERPEEERLVLVEDRDLPDPRASRVALYRGPWKLERRRVGGEEQVRLFDLRADAIGEHDVAEEHPDVRAELLAELEGLTAELGGEDSGGEGPGAASVDALRALGYLGD